MIKPQTAQVWPEIEEILVNHGEGAPPPCQPPAGTREFVSAEGSDVMVLSGAEARFAGDTLTAVYYAIRPGIYFVDLPDSAEGRARMLILDDTRGRVLQTEIVAPIPGTPDGLLDRLALRTSQSAVGVTYHHWFAPEAEQTPFTSSPRLIGKQFRYTYSSTHQYDHFYINDRYYAWHCLKGPDAGLGDFDECAHFEIAENLVLFVWKEKLLPCAGFTIEDHDAKRTIGKIFGANSNSGEARGAIVGADLTMIADISGT